MTRFAAGRQAANRVIPDDTAADTVECDERVKWPRSCAGGTL